MAVNGDVERMTSSDLELTSQTETEDTDTGDLEESGTTFSSSDGNESSFTSVSSSCSSKISKDSQNIDMKSVSSADGSTSTGDTEQSDTDKSDVIFKYPSVPKVSYDLTEVSELSNFENLSNYERKFSSHSLREDKRKDVTDRKTHQFPDFMSLQGDWFKHPCFKRYWDHYSSVMGWCNKHYQVYNSVVKTDTKTSMHRQFQDTPQISNMLSWQQYYLNSYYGGLNVQNGNRTMDRRSNGSAKKKTVKKRKRKRSVRSRSSKGEGPEGKDDDDDDEQFEMEITDGMMEFFKQSEEHRRAREEEKQASMEAGGQEEEHVNIEEVKVTAQKGPTTEAPKDRPGAKRTSEMKLLYGKGAPMIHGMETALQMTFDRNLDVKQPKLWPNMPLKLVFG